MVPSHEMNIDQHSHALMPTLPSSDRPQGAMTALRAAVHWATMSPLNACR
jgi:hypothetical protein